MLGTQMDRTKLQALANELAKDIKTEADLNSKWLKAYRYKTYTMSRVLHLAQPI